jgi:hypothetical protein
VYNENEKIPKLTPLNTLLYIISMASIHHAMAQDEVPVLESTDQKY